MERGDEGTSHYQGYICFKFNKTLHAVKFNPRAHWELRGGKHEEAKAYCSKEETRVDGPWTYGEEPQKGKRTDLLLLKERLDAGVPVRDIWRDPETFPIVSKYERSSPLPSCYRPSAAVQDACPCPLRSPLDLESPTFLLLSTQMPTTRTRPNGGTVTSTRRLSSLTTSLVLGSSILFFSSS